MNQEFQPIFDRIATHLLNQGKRAQRLGGGCRYYAPDGLKCAVGCLIDEKHYDENLEGSSADDPLVEAALEASIGRGLTGDEVLMLEALQEIHDHDRPENWAESLQEFAHKNDLVMPAI